MFFYVFVKYRHYLVRDVYDDMMLDGVKPERDTFRSLIASTMMGARLQDALYFRDQMRSMGLCPDVLLSTGYSLHIIIVIVIIVVVLFLFFERLHYF